MHGIGSCLIHNQDIWIQFPELLIRKNNNIWFWLQIFKMSENILGSWYMIQDPQILLSLGNQRIFVIAMILTSPFPSSGRGQVLYLMLHSLLQNTSEASSVRIACPYLRRAWSCCIVVSFGGIQNISEECCNCRNDSSPVLPHINCHT